MISLIEYPTAMAGLPECTNLSLPRLALQKSAPPPNAKLCVFRLVSAIIGVAHTMFGPNFTTIPIFAGLSSGRYGMAGGNGGIPA